MPVLQVCVCVRERERERERVYIHRSQAQMRAIAQILHMPALQVCV